MGSTLVRWAATEAVVRYHGGDAISPAYRRIAERRGRKIARVAAARKLLILVYYGMRDGRIRCLAEAGPASWRAGGVLPESQGWVTRVPRPSRLPLRAAGARP